MLLNELGVALGRAYGVRVSRLDVLTWTDRRLLVKVVDAAGRHCVLKNRPPWIGAVDFETVLGLQV